jgi:hypothetical protein
MDKHGMLGELLEKGQGAADSVKKSVSDTAKAAATQVTGIGGDKPGQNKTPSVDKDFVKDLYGVKDETQVQSDSPDQAVASEQEQVKEQKKAEDQQEIARLRNKLHQETYYEPLVNPPKEEEERPAEKIEKEKKIEEQELQQKEAEKPAPLAVKRAQTSTETNRGVSG